MADLLKNFQNRDIFTKPEYGIDGVYHLGERIFKFLKKIEEDTEIKEVLVQTNIDEFENTA